MGEPTGDESASFKPVPTRRALGSIVSDFLKPEPLPKNLPSGQVKKIVNGLDRRERLCGILLTMLNLYVVFVRSNQLRSDPKPSLQAEATPFLILGIALTAVAVTGILARRRALLGFAMAFMGLVFLQYEMVMQFVLSAAYGFYLIVRAQKLQKLQRATNPQARTSGRRQSKKGAAEPSVRAPSASKRYTPPKRSRASGRR